MSKQVLRKILKISRPRFWTYLFGTFVIGYLSGLQSLEKVNLMEFLALGLYFLLPANILLYGINDYFDIEVDKYNSKKQIKEYRATKPDLKFLLILISANLIISCLILAILPNTAKLAFVLFLFLAIFYSAKPVRFKNVFFLDHLSNSLYFLPGVIGYYMTTTKNLSWEFLILGITWTSAMHLFSAIPDISSDKKSGTTTTATILGINKSLLLCSIYWFVFGITAISVKDLGVIRYFSFVYTIIPLFLLLKHADYIAKIYWLFPYINAIAGILTFLFILVNKL